MQLALTRILLLQIFMSCCGLTITAYADVYNQFQLDLMLAKRGDPGAQFSVAGAYEEGRDVRKDLGKALNWYSLAAKSNNNAAQFKLGQFYENGWGVKADKKKAQFWYRKAEQNGSRLATAYLRKLEVNKQVEATAKARRKEVKQRHLANEKARKKKERQMAAARTRREKAARQQNSVRAKSIIAVAALASAKKKKFLEKDKAAARAKYMQFLLKNKWHSKAIASEVLPSSLNNCLRSSETELVCFSREQQAVIGNSRVTFTTKSIINNFKYNGDFTVSYYFDVLNVHDALVSGSESDPLGLRVEKGWQEPQQSMKCNISNARKLKCRRNGQNFFFQP